MMPRGCLTPVPFTNAVPSFLPKSLARASRQFRLDIDGGVFKQLNGNIGISFQPENRNFELPESRLGFGFGFDLAFPQGIRNSGSRRQDHCRSWQSARREPQRALAKTVSECRIISVENCGGAK